MVKITVFTPTYNRSKYLERIFECLSKQTNMNFVWLIIDDGSTDDTKERVNYFKKNAKFKINYYYKKNGGKHSAHNTAVNLCKTDYFLILDSDDYLEVNSIEILNNYIKLIDNDNKISGIIGNRFNIDNKSVIGRELPNIKFASGIELYQKYQFVGDTLRMYKTDILKKNLFPIIPNEKFVYENVVFDKIDAYYKMLVIHDKLYFGEYLNDGYTKKSKILKIKNPIGYALSLYSSARYSLLIRKKFNMYILYFIWIDKMNLSVNVNKWLKFFYYPFYKLLEILKYPKFFFELFDLRRELENEEKN